MLILLAYHSNVATDAPGNRVVSIEPENRRRESCHASSWGSAWQVCDDIHEWFQAMGITYKLVWNYKQGIWYLDIDSSRDVALFKLAWVGV